MWKEKEMANKIFELLKEHPILFGFGTGMITVFVVDIFWLWEYGFWEWINAEDAGEVKVDVSRNRVLLLLAILGAALAIWGRLILREHLKQYEAELNLHKQRGGYQKELYPDKQEKPKKKYKGFLKFWFVYVIYIFGWVILGIFALDIFVLREYNFWDWVNAKDIMNDGQVAAAVSRNRGGAVLAVIGFGFLAWGRIMTKEQNQQTQTQIEQKEKELKQTQQQIDVAQSVNVYDRYERAARMLSNDVISVRIAGCRALLALAKDNKDMLSPCSGLLFSYIKAPYFSKEEEQKKIREMKNVKGDFSYDVELRGDIQEAIYSVSAIYQHAFDSGEKLADEIAPLPSYFWHNVEKADICLACGHFFRPDMQKAYLSLANLQSTILFKANLKDATLHGADLQNANLLAANLESTNITIANFKGAYNLTKEQILSALWMIADHGDGPPKLPEQLMKDSDIKIWCNAPDYVFKSGQFIWNEKKMKWRKELGIELQDYLNYLIEIKAKKAKAKKGKGKKGKNKKSKGKAKKARGKKD